MDDAIHEPQGTSKELWDKVAEKFWRQEKKGNNTHRPQRKKRLLLVSFSFCTTNEKSRREEKGDEVTGQFELD